MLFLLHPTLEIGTYVVTVLHNPWEKLIVNFNGKWLHKKLNSLNVKLILISHLDQSIEYLLGFIFIVERVKKNRIELLLINLLL